MKTSKLKLGLRETSTGDRSSHHDVAVDGMVKNSTETDEELAGKSNVGVPCDDDADYLGFYISLKMMKHSEFKLGPREASTGGQSSQCEIAVDDMIKNAAETDEGLAEESKAWATNLGIRYQTLERRLKAVHDTLSERDVECSELRQGIQRRDALIATLQNVHNSTEGSDTYPGLV